MYSIFKLINGELEKIFVRPAIFIMTAFLVIALIFTVLTFSPAQRENNIIDIDGTTIVSVNTKFINNILYKSNYDDKLEELDGLLDFYSSLSNTLDVITKSSLLTQIDDIDGIFQNYTTAAINASSSTESYRQSLLLATQNLITSIESINSSYASLYITKNNYEKLLNNANILYAQISVTGNTSSSDFHMSIFEQVSENNYIGIIDNILDNVEQIIVSSDEITQLRSYYTTAISKCELINDTMLASVVQANSSSDYNMNSDNVALFKQLVTNYYLTTVEAKEIIYNNILLYITEIKSYNQILSYYGNDFEDYNQYKLKESIVKNNYLFENDLYEYEFANVFQAGYTSNYEINAYDFVYYGLEFLSFIIIIFCVVIGAGMIAGENMGGTMKLLAIRPYKRHKIMSSKIIATMVFGIIFLAISTIITFIVGTNAYSLDSSKIMCIINAETIVFVEPYILMLIYLFTLIVRIAVYTMLAVFISTAFKSNMAAVIISILIYLFVALLGNSLFASSEFYQYLPFSNLDFFKFFGGTFNNGGNASGAFGLQFTSPLLSNMNLLFSGIITAVFAIILIIPTYTIFKNRDID